MLAKRTLLLLLLWLVGIAAIVWGGVVFAAAITLLLGLAAWGFVDLFRAAGFQPASFLVIVGALLFAIGREVNGFKSAWWLVGLIVMVNMVYHLIAYERGREGAVSDLVITLAGLLYVGWLGAYSISLRNLPEGLGWILIVLVVVWLASCTAQLMDSRMNGQSSPRSLSLNRSWQAQLGGILVATLFTPLFFYIWQTWVDPVIHITLLGGVGLGFVLGALTMVSDLVEREIYHQIDGKHFNQPSFVLSPAFQWVNSWLLAGGIGYYLIEWFFT